MARVVIVVFEGVHTLDVTGPAEVFACAVRQNRGASYQVVLASTRGETITTSAGIRMETSALASLAVRRSDRVLVAGGDEAPVTRAVLERGQ